MEPQEEPSSSFLEIWANWKAVLSPWHLPAWQAAWDGLVVVFLLCFALMEQVLCGVLGKDR